MGTLILTIVFAILPLLYQFDKRLSLNFVRKIFIKRNAKKIAFTYSKNIDSTIVSKCKIYVLRNEGVEHQNINTVTGNLDNLAVTLFDLIWSKNVGRKRKYYACSIFMVKAENKSLPEFHIKPNKRKFHRSPGIRIDFKESPDFHSRYLLFSDDVQGTQKVISYEVAQLISKKKNFCFEVDEDMLFIWSPKKLVPILKYREFYEYALSIANKIFK